MKLKLNTQNIFFTSDWHLWHGNVIKFDDRPFNNLFEMHDKLIENWNNSVNEDSIVFYLGDLSFRSPNKTNIILDKLKPVNKFYNLMGNHDRYKDIKKLNIFDDVYDYLDLDIEDEEAKDGFQRICLMHYPILSWNKKSHGSWHLHGHCHQNLVGTEIGDIFYKGKVIDVGTNGHNYELLSYQKVKEIMLNK